MVQTLPRTRSLAPSLPSSTEEQAPPRQCQDWSHSRVDHTKREQSPDEGLWVVSSRQRSGKCIQFTSLLVHPRGRRRGATCRSQQAKKGQSWCSKDRGPKEFLLTKSEEPPKNQAQNYQLQIHFGHIQKGVENRMSDAHPCS